MWGKGERKGVVKTVARMRLVVWLRPHLPALAVVLALMLIQSAAMLLQPWLGGVMTDRLMLNQHLGCLLYTSRCV